MQVTGPLGRLEPAPVRFRRIPTRDYALKALNFAIRRDLRRAALLRWMTPFCAALSSSLMAARTALSARALSPVAMVASAFFTKVRIRERTLRLRIRRLAF